MSASVQRSVKKHCVTLDSSSAFWTIRIVDLGFIVPIAIYTGVGLWRGRPAATKVAYGLASFLTLQSAAVLAMGVVMLWRQDPTASPVLVYALAPIVLALIVLTALLLASYARGGSDVNRHSRDRMPAAA